MNIINGSIKEFPSYVRQFIQHWYERSQPQAVYICDGSNRERTFLIQKLLESKTLVHLKKYKECYLARTNPQDVARLVNKTFMCTNDKRSSMTIGKMGCSEFIGLWIHEDEMRPRLEELFFRCMEGRTMYIIPYCMGPLGSPIAKVAIQLTDSPYAALCMGIMTRVGREIIPHLSPLFVKSVHSVGVPLSQRETYSGFNDPWPCNPEKTVITHFPMTNEIISFGSGYGGNSLLGKKCLALRLASNMARKEGWLAEHMLIIGLISPENEKIYICAAFPSACGKTNVAMMSPALPGWKVTCLGDDIAWLWFDQEGRLRAINPENGLFGVCPGTNRVSNPVAMEVMLHDTIFTNVCETSEGGVFWEGLEKESNMEDKFIDWQNEEWDPKSGKKAAHPNSRFCSPIENCPILDDKWNDPEGVPISAIIFGGRRPKGIPLVLQSLDWVHGVLIGSSVKSETTTAASDVVQNTIQHDPFAMRPFFGYNCGHYMQHWLDIGKISGRKLPLIFHVNWFLKDEKGNFLWPGFGQNIRVLKWIFERCQGKENFVQTPVGYLPTKRSFELTGLKNVDFDKLFLIKNEFWKNELHENRNFFETVINEEFPSELDLALKKLEERLSLIHI